MSDHSLTILRSDDRRLGTRMGRRRAIVLVVVHLLVAVHVVWWLSTGRALSPLEPSEAGFTLRDGAINAGAVLLLLAIVATFVFGRFFCGWACHLVAYQDAARWMLMRVGLAPTPVRSRALLLVPLFAAGWLFVRPVWQRMMADQTEPWRWELMTRDLWATFPGPIISIATFVIAGGAIVWFLGAKGFCTYGCPYGAIFVHVDRVARGRIHVNEDCDHTGTCTRVCTSNVDVAGEVARYGHVVDPGCMKCMDCVSACPNDALSFGFTKQVERPDPPKRAARWGYSMAEEIALAALFTIVFLCTFNLYRQIPLLLAIALSVIVAVGVVTLVRLVRRRDLTAQRVVLRRDGRVTRGGVLFGAAMLGVVALVAHSGVMQWHTHVGTRDFERAMAARVDGAPDDALADRAVAHLDVVETWGLGHHNGGARMRGERARWAGDLDRAIALFTEEIEHGSRNPAVPMLRGLARYEAGDVDGGIADIEASFADGAALTRAQMFDWEVGRMYRVSGRDPSWYRALFVCHLTVLRDVLEQHPGASTLAISACRMLMQAPDPALRDPGAALEIARRAVEHADPPTAMLLSMTAALLEQRGEIDAALELAGRAVTRADAEGDAAAAAAFRSDLDAMRRRNGR